MATYQNQQYGGSGSGQRHPAGMGGPQSAGMSSDPRDMDPYQGEMRQNQASHRSQPDAKVKVAAYNCTIDRGPHRIRLLLQYQYLTICMYAIMRVLYFYHCCRAQ